MSLYQVDKVLHEVTVDDARRVRFLAAPDQYLENRDLTAPERHALIDKDCAALYGLGGHPFLLATFLRRTGTRDGYGVDRELLRRYCEAIEPFGFPDHST